jgi:hypothetical protein
MTHDTEITELETNRPTNLDIPVSSIFVDRLGATFSFPISDALAFTTGFKRSVRHIPRERDSICTRRSLFDAISPDQ